MTYRIKDWDSIYEKAHTEKPQDRPPREQPTPAQPR